MSNDPQLPLGWARSTLGETCNWGSGGTPRRTVQAYFDGDIPWAIIGDLNDGVVTETESTITQDGLASSSAKWIQPGSVLVAMYGSIGKLGIAGMPLTSNQAIAFAESEVLAPKFLFYYLMMQRSELQHRGKGGTQRNISQTVLKAFPVVIAPKCEQRRIVNAIETEFTKLDAAEASLGRAQRNLERYRASVLQAAVEGRLVPTEASLARAEGREYEPASALLERILAERRRRWEEAELAKLEAKGKRPKGDAWKRRYKEPVAPKAEDLTELPKGWEWASLGQVAPLQAGYAFPSAGFSDSGVRLLKGLNVRDGWLYEEEVDHWPSSDAHAFHRFLLREGDIVLAMDRPVYSSGSKATKVAVLGRSWDGALLLQRVGCFRRTSEIDGTYLSWFLRSRYFKLHLVGGQKGSQDGKDLPHVSARTVDACPIPLPPRREQRRLGQELDRLLSTQEAVGVDVQRFSARVVHLRQSILRSAFSGRLVPQDPADEPASALLERIRAGNRRPHDQAGWRGNGTRSVGHLGDYA